MTTTESILDLAAQNNTETAKMENDSSSEKSGEVEKGSNELSQTQTNQTQTTEGKTSEGEKTEQAKAAPEKYDLKFAEGIVVDKELMTKFTEVAKKNGLTNEAAQEIANLQMEYAKTQAEKTLTDYSATTEKWKQESIKQLGPEYQKEIADVVKFTNMFFSPEEVQIMNDTGIINKLAPSFAKIAKHFKEDHFPDGKQNNMGTPRPIEDRLYGKN